MRKIDDDETLRLSTIDYWRNFAYPGNERDIKRVYAFRDLDPATATNDDVTRAYGGPGWSRSEPCQECGSHSNPRVLVGGAVICNVCLAEASALVSDPPAVMAPDEVVEPEQVAPGSVVVLEPAPKRSFFSRFFGG